MKMVKVSKGTIACLALLSLIVGACNPGNYRPLLKSSYDRVSDTLKYVHVINSKSPSSDLYRIQPYDMLSVRNRQIGQITQEGAERVQQSSDSEVEGFRVEDDGNVNLPVIGKVYVMNLTRKEATDKVQGIYKLSLLKDPLIDISIINSKVTILGEVVSQGTYPLERENISLIEIIGAAGGLTAKADPKTLKIIRGNKANPEIIYVNLENLQSLTNSKIILQNNDIVYIEPDKRINKYEKSQSGFGIFQSVLVVISTGLIVFTSFFK